MDWGLIFQVTLAVLGVALMVDGIVACVAPTLLGQCGVRTVPRAGYRCPSRASFKFCSGVRVNWVWLKNSR